MVINSCLFSSFFFCSTHAVSEMTNLFDISFIHKHSSCREAQSFPFQMRAATPQGTIFWCTSNIKPEARGRWDALEGVSGGCRIGDRRQLKLVPFNFVCGHASSYLGPQKNWMMGPGGNENHIAWPISPINPTCRGQVICDEDEMLGNCLIGNSRNGNESIAGEEFFDKTQTDAFNRYSGVGPRDCPFTVIHWMHSEEHLLSSKRFEFGSHKIYSLMNFTQLEAVDRLDQKNRKRPSSRVVMHWKSINRKIDDQCTRTSWAMDGRDGVEQQVKPLYKRQTRSYYKFILGPI